MTSTTRKSNFKKHLSYFSDCYINAAQCIEFSSVIKLLRSENQELSLSPRTAIMISIAHLALAFGILGNIVSFLVYLAPLPTFYRIYRKKSTEGFQSIPYAVALFSSMLLLYYGFLKQNGLMLITINSIGSFMETIYLIFFLTYATKEAKVYTTKVVILFNIGAYGAIVFSTFVFVSGHPRLALVGWICAVFSVCVFAAPLSIMRQVIRTKSVEFMPFSLSFFLTLCAIIWFFYGFLIKDYYIAMPNILGFAFGIAQMLLYSIYKSNKNQVLPEVDKLQDLTSVIVIGLSGALESSTEPDKAEDAMVDEKDGGMASNKTSEPNEANV
ncbi:hypothetical protein RJ639_000422 [Escallonia herrerae]|uniref:Bidirectional sugar transporter SWEET n=1 Tax=Escallonia herrerae TaxID=1293975 RepID=A0AA89BGH7_9ASTE|nr:hypothetical protein RJ639_000422 [Escallonia herrerae]